MPSAAATRKKPGGGQDAGGGKTKVVQHGKSRGRLPHERDESSDSQQGQGGEPPEVGKRAHEDIERGLVDTDRGPVIERLDREKYRR